MIREAIGAESHGSLDETAWKRMLAIYGQDGIPALCLKLQDRFHADIPLLLLLAIADRSGWSPASSLQELISGAAAWRETVVKPLRALRIALREIVRSEVGAAFRERIKQVELEAERLHVVRLASTFSPRPADGRLALSYLTALSVPEAEALAAIARIHAALTETAEAGS